MKKYSKKNKRRKSPQMIYWENKLLPILGKIHGTHARNVFHRVMRKSSNLKSSLKKRSKEYEVIFDIDLLALREMIFKDYGKKCRYCKTRLVVNNMACDHINPMSMGGASISENLQIICERCNRRKGPLTHIEYNALCIFLEQQEEHVRSYVNRKLSGKEAF